MIEVLIALIGFILIGAFAGVLGGLLGIGGGVITVPSLYFLFRLLDYPHSNLMLVAIGTSLGAMVLNTISSTRAFNKRGSVKWDIFKQLIPGLLIGSILGAFIANQLEGAVLRYGFGLFLILLAIKFFKEKPSHQEHHVLPKPLLLAFLSTGIGTISNILGIGGGTLLVPLLSSFRLEPKKAIGTSAACTLFVTCVGATSYLILGWKETDFPKTIGYVSLPAFLLVGIVSYITALYGVKLTHQLKPQKIRKIFAAVLLITAIMMLSNFVK